MREIMMFEESAADLEGGDMDEDLSEYLPQQPVAPAARVRGGATGVMSTFVNGRKVFSLLVVVV